MDAFMAANIDRRLKLLMERFEAMEARLALLEAAEVALEAVEQAEDEASPTKPWHALGVSKATYYRRLRDASSTARPEGV